MKRTILCLGMLAIILAFGMTVVGCDVPKDELDGTTWRGSYVNDQGTTAATYVLTFDSPNFTFSETRPGQTSTYSGTYTISGKIVTLTFLTHYDVPIEVPPETATLSGNKLSFDDSIGLHGLTLTKE